MVLARLLVPEEFGLVAMAMAFTAFFTMFSDFGLATGTVQREDLTGSEVTAMFWLNSLLGLLIAALVAALAPLVAWFYKDSRLVVLTLVLSLGFVFTGLGVQHRALLKRQIRLVRLAVVDVLSMALGVAAGVVAAVSGMGHWSLVVMTLVTAAASTAGAWVACRWRPGLPRHGSSVGELVRFGGYLTGHGVVSYLVRNADVLLIGRYLGAAPLGIYSRAYHLLLLPLTQVITPLSSVGIPTLSRLASDPERYRRAYKRLLEQISLVTMPMVVYLTVCADWIVTVVLGPGWEDVVPIFRVLGIAALFQPVSAAAGWLMISQGRVRQLWHWAWIHGVPAVACFFIGLPWGPLGIAAAYAFMGLVFRAFVFYWYVGRQGPVRTSDIYRALGPAGCVTLCLLPVLGGFRFFLGAMHPLAGMIAAGILAAAVTFGLTAAFPSGRSLLVEWRTLLVGLLRRAGTEVDPESSRPL
jgi:PST family polysaccharide transporter